MVEINPTLEPMECISLNTLDLPARMIGLEQFGVSRGAERLRRYARGAEPVTNVPEFTDWTHQHDLATGSGFGACGCSSVDADSFFADAPLRSASSNLPGSIEQ
jgi:hypothetical protein